MNYEVVSVGSLQTRVTTAAENGNGPDMTTVGFNWAFLFDEKLVDVSDIADEIGKESGGWYESAQEAVVVNGKWKAIPFGNIGQLMNWRTDWFKRGRLREVPRHLGRAPGGRHQARRRPAIRSASSSVTASATTTAGSIRCCGPTAAREVEADGKTIVIDSDETARAIDYCRKLYQETMLEDCLGWTDVSNNKAFLSRADLLHQQRREHPVGRPRRTSPTSAKVTDQSQNPKGPKGRFHMLESAGAMRSSRIPRTRRRRRTSCAG